MIFNGKKRIWICIKFFKLNFPCIYILTNNWLKSNSSVILSTALKTFGEITPAKVIRIDSKSARTISPIVWGNFNSLILIKEKIEAKQSKMVDNSKTPKTYYLIKYT